MTATTYQGWLAEGSPAVPARPIVAMVAMFRRRGFTQTGYYPDLRHLQASLPEDHCPYSHTPWPGSQPYPKILALDWMPLVEGDAKSLTAVARRIIADKDAGRAPWIKYINWTDEDGNCWHTSWQPDKVTKSSTDRGHVHISIRTDFADSAAADDWDPFVAPPTPRDESTMFLATPDAKISPTSPMYLCDGMTSRPISQGDASTVLYCASSGYGALYDLRRGDPNKNPQAGSHEWADFAGQRAAVRINWGPAYCGVVGTPITLQPGDIDKIAQETAAAIEFPTYQPVPSAP